ncbi:hypothetical protein [Flavihumibacter sp. CACIAM 22H1]|uniref:hypothetical protein n=1 Tax=Flavihumibacter sp. CACIAM 22H1 TaxID=1812911 RepID=UPI0007A92018|nr:hypothetical protein [Flavihumibacter sp. CACIAM 22H1]KYP13753.1 MAG: hypothetical protein A1D16_18965 [Flavihumibacter sp. CACIAM 22H1]
MINKLLFFAVVFFQIAASNAQSGENYVRFIDRYKGLIDTILLMESREELILEQHQESVVKQAIKNKDTGQEVEVHGGSSLSFYFNPDCKVVYKISYHDNLSGNFYLNFLYKKNKLLLAEASFREDSTGELLYSRLHYYNNKRLVKSVTSGEWENVNRHFQKAPDLYTLAYSYLKLAIGEIVRQ